MTAPDSPEIEIESLALGGDGVGRLPDGRAVFVPYTAPGDRVRVRITTAKRNFARGLVTERLQDSPAREEAPCAWYEKCPGCQYQHLSYSAELEAKQQQVRDAVERIGKIDPALVRPIIASPRRYGYRNRITLHTRDGVTGFYAHDNRRIVAIRQCLLADEHINRQLASVAGRRGPDRRVTLRVPGTSAGFSQANLFLQETLLDTVRDLAPPQGTMLVEGYAGNGWFTRALAGRFQRVTAIELDPRLVDMARTAFSDSPNVEFLVGECEHWLPETLQRHGADVDLLLLDPPREGLSTRIREAVALAPARRLIYVSCNPATLARDLGSLGSHWRLRSIQPLDMFPATAHIECVAYGERDS